MTKLPFLSSYWVLFLLATILGWTCALSPIHAYDAFWHIATFRDFWESGQSVYIDHFTYTFNGQEIRSYTALPFQALAYSLTEWMGIGVGLQATKAVAFGLTTFAWFAICKHFRTGLWVCALGTFILLGVLQYRSIARPEIFIFPLMIVISAWTASNRYNVELRKLWLPGILLWLAMMMHNSASLCFIVAGTYAFGRILDGLRLRRGPLVSYGIKAGLIFLAISFANPNLRSPLVNALLFQLSTDADTIRAIVTEYGTPSPGGLVVVLTLAPVALICAIRWFRKRAWTPLILLVGFGFMSLTTLRAAPFVALATLPWIAATLAPIARKWRGSAATRWMQGLALATLVAWWLQPYNYLRSPSFGLISPARFPVGLSTSLASAEGRVFSIFNYGGYLAYAHPNLKTHADGRSNILFPFDFVQLNVAATLLPEKFAEVISGPAEPDYILTKNSEALLILAGTSNEFDIEDADQFFTLFSRRPGRFPVATRLLNADPSCVPIAAIRDEYARFQSYDSTLPATALRGTSLVSALLRAAIATAELETDDAYLPDAVTREVNRHAHAIRLVARRAAASGLMQTSLRYFRRLDPGFFRRFDMRAYAAILHETGEAEAASAEFLRLSSTDSRHSQVWRLLLATLDEAPALGDVDACAVTPGEQPP